ncbi:ankyrin repeat domain-containing protein [Saccharibacillus sacchari]|uniref:ankyrin repeat domain-containing protein n=1 Tax=Saccharibacillus sacchari TaxID=456493 RepID=UPI0004BA0410|nr:ankyrin repeat domain-containing protein [Saccharibacillus sacchari]
MRKRKAWLNIGLLMILSTALSACGSTIASIMSSPAFSSDANTYGGMYSELNIAVREGNLEEVQRLIDQGASPHEAADYGSGADRVDVGNLSLAINYNDDPFPMVQLLLENGVNPQDDPMAFNDAIGTEDVTLVQLMLDYGADATSGLQMAIAKGQIHMIQTLIQYGADPNAGVHLAKSMLNEDALILLEEYGAIVEDIPREQLYPEDYVEENGTLIRLR